MAKAILEFDLTDFDDQIEHKRCVHATDMAMFIWEIKNNFIRQIRKEELTPNQIIDRLHEKLNELGFDIDQLGG